MEQTEETALAKSTGIVLLLDFYGEMLSEKQRETLTLYYDEDMSLAEIADLTGLTRAGVRDRLVKGEALLREWEERLQLAQRYTAFRREAEALEQRLKALSEKGGADPGELNAVRQILAELTDRF